MSRFLLGGGAIFFLGENGNPTFDDENNDINAALLALGSSLSIAPDSIDAGFNFTSPDQVIPNPLTAGVNEFTYALTSEVSGGHPLLLTADLSVAFIAAEDVIGVPEPSAMSLTLLGLTSLAAMRRCRRENSA